MRRGRAPANTLPMRPDPVCVMAPKYRRHHTHRAGRSGRDWRGTLQIGGSPAPGTPAPPYGRSRRAFANLRPPCRTRRGIAVAIANAIPLHPRDTTDAAGLHRSLTGAPPPPKPPRLPTVGACALCVPLRGRLRPRRYRLRNVALPLSRLVCLAGRSSEQARRASTYVSGCSGMAGTCALIPLAPAKTPDAPCFRFAHVAFCSGLGGLLTPRSALPPSAFPAIPTPLHFGSSPVAPALPPKYVSARGYAPSGLVCRLARSKAVRTALATLGGWACALSDGRAPWGLGVAAATKPTDVGLCLSALPRVLLL